MIAAVPRVNFALAFTLALTLMIPFTCVCAEAALETNNTAAAMTPVQTAFFMTPAP